MYLALGLQIPQEVTDGIILLDQQGNILSHNHAANTLVQQGAALRMVLKRAVESEARSGEALPKQLEFFLGAFNQPKRKTKAWLCRYGVKEFAIFIAPDADALAQTAQADESGMSPVDLLGDRVREKMAVLRSLLKGGAGAVARDEAAIAATSDQLDQLLAAASELAQLLQRDQVFDDARLNLAEQIRQIAPGLWAGCGVRYVISPPVGAGSVTHDGGDHRAAVGGSDQHRWHGTEHRQLFNVIRRLRAAARCAAGADGPSVRAHIECASTGQAGKLTRGAAPRSDPCARRAAPESSRTARRCRRKKPATAG